MSDAGAVKVLTGDVGSWEERLLDEIDAGCDLAAAGARVVVQVARTREPSVAAETAARLVAGLRRRHPELDVALLAVPAGEDRGPSAASWRLASPVEPDGVRIPTFWCEDVHLVTVAPVVTDVLCRIGAVLDAQAQILAELNPDLPRLDLLFEAHRLGASDVAIACGIDTNGTPFWLVGRSDVAVEAAVAEAAGLAPSTLPHLRIFTDVDSSRAASARDAALPSVAGISPARWQSFGAAAVQAARRGMRRAVRDVRLAASSAERVPEFLRRHLPALTRERDG